RNQRKNANGHINQRETQQKALKLKKKQELEAKKAQKVDDAKRTALLEQSGSQNLDDDYTLQQETIVTTNADWSAACQAAGQEHCTLAHGAESNNSISLLFTISKAACPSGVRVDSEAGSSLKEGECSLALEIEGHPLTGRIHTQSSDDNEISLIITLGNLPHLVDSDGNPKEDATLQITVEDSYGGEFTFQHLFRLVDQNVLQTDAPDADAETVTPDTNAITDYPPSEEPSASQSVAPSSTPSSTPPTALPTQGPTQETVSPIESTNSATNSGTDSSKQTSPPLLLTNIKLVNPDDLALTMNPKTFINSFEIKRPDAKISYTSQIKVVKNDILEGIQIEVDENNYICTSEQNSFDSNGVNIAEIINGECLVDHKNQTIPISVESPNNITYDKGESRISLTKDNKGWFTFKHSSSNILQDESIELKPSCEENEDTFILTTDTAGSKEELEAYIGVHPIFQKVTFPISAGYIATHRTLFVKVDKCALKDWTLHLKDHAGETQCD
ncbi:hypothetical protein MJH12_02575, partial [bacterium]|nr:hypothetical protein [bacterium]